HHHAQLRQRLRFRPRGRQVQRPAQPDRRRYRRVHERVERIEADDAQHLIGVSPQMPGSERTHAPMSWDESPALSHSPSAPNCTLNIQPLPYGSELTSSGAWLSSSLTATTSPVTGAYISLAALTLSTTAHSLPASIRAPTSGNSTYTMSVNSCCAWS